MAAQAHKLITGIQPNLHSGMPDFSHV